MGKEWPYAVIGILIVGWVLLMIFVLLNAGCGNPAPIPDYRDIIFWA